MRRMTISRPTPLVVIPDDIVVGRVRVGIKIALDQVPPSFASSAPGVQVDGVMSFCH
jgi:hypothetical protein